ncbi:MAG TPA: B12-binding domain-containing radical SAM protein [Spirochaetes bacterium]|nr:B12-binding domain-containing radical SAM protein [Spirochaetota bacterium]
MKVLLVNPPYPFEESPTPPFGLMSLAAYLIERGFDVVIEDYIVRPYTPERAERALIEHRPDVVGSTAVTMNVKGALSILKDYKSAGPGIVTVMGGPHVSFDADAILSQNPQLDYIVRGEGEITFTELLSALEERGPIDGIAGISYRRDGNVTHNQDRPLIPDINVLPYPARHLVSLSKYRALGFPVNMVTSRGCPNKCIFCVGGRMVGRRVRNFDVQRVVDEFEMLSKLGFRQINVVDDLFTANRKRCMAICDEIIRRGIKHKWVAFARVDTVSRELLERMKEAGCTTLCFGVESGNQEILDLVKKNITLEKCRRAVELCKEVGMEPMTSYILGLPGETPETVKKTLEFARKLSPMYGYHILAPFPGTEVREKAEEYGMRILTDDWDLYDANQSVAESIYMGHEEIDRIVNDFNNGIKRYVQGLARSKQEGKTISKSDEDMVNGIVSFDFNQKLLLGEMLEAYPGMANGAPGEEVLGNLARYLSEKTGYSVDDTEKQLRRLIELNCIKIEETSGGKTVRWQS